MLLLDFMGQLFDKFVANFSIRQLPECYVA